MENLSLSIRSELTGETKSIRSDIKDFYRYARPSYFAGSIKPPELLSAPITDQPLKTRFNMPLIGRVDFH